MTGRFWEVARRRILLLVATLPAVASVGTANELRDIREPVPPSGAPPFAATAVILAGAAVGVAIFFRRRRGGPVLPPAPERIPQPLSDELRALREAYRRGDLSDSLLFDRLEPLLRSLLADGERPALTSGELLAAAERSLPAEELARAAALLELCDRVRFGRFAPGPAVSLGALDDFLDLVFFPPERRR